MFKRIWNALSGKQRARNHATTILVVEDNDVDLRLLKNILERQGYTVTHAANGREGLSRARQEIPDLIVLDCEMPVLNGIEMCKQIKDAPKTRDIPVLFLTSIKTPTNVIECFEAEAENYLEKPVDPKVLVHEIEHILGKQ
jgi:CheY-like chemotaxis protein